MTRESPQRLKRRAAARNPKVVASSDESQHENIPPEANKENYESTSAATKSARRTPGRRGQTNQQPATHRTKRASVKVEPHDEQNISTSTRVSKIAKDNEFALDLSSSETHYNAPKHPDGQTTEDSTGRERPMSIPEPSEPPSVDAKHTDALADITTNSVNSQPKQQEKTEILEDRKLDAQMQSHEKPMDIVIRTRTKPSVVPEEPVEPRPRMVITYLILHNFKSYAGKQEVGPFHASFSSVVGPNGSGKSNVIDALLFVFGFRASKMRQGKISSLIHNSAAFPDLNHCEVEVFFEEMIDQASGAKEILPDSKVVVSRKAFKNNSSKYYVNGAESNFTAVTSMLRERGIDLDHKRFLILQGEVESIAQMKPKAANEHEDGLLEYLEDIIGTSKYKSSIENSATETEALNEVCHEKNNRVQHVEKEKKSLEDKKSAALAYIKDENELAIKQSALWQMFVHECEDNIQVSEEATTQLQTQLQGKVERHQGREDQIRKLEREHAAESKQFGKMEQATQSLLRQLAKVDKEAVKFDEKKKHLNNKISKLEKSVSSSRSAAAEAVAYSQRLSEDLIRNNSSISSIQDELQHEEDTLDTIRDTLKGKTEGISEKINEKQKLLEPWMSQIGEKRSAIAVAQSEMQMLRDREASGAHALADMRQKLERLQSEKSEKESILREHQSEKASLEAESEKLETGVGDISRREPDARSKVSAARQKADEARASLSNSQTQGNVLSGLMRLKESGRISGFHGRLGNLGAIDSKYDVAISTACPALDNLVVDSVEVGQQCIDFLRKNNLGRANFILLDRLAHRDFGQIQTPEDVPRLFDLVRPQYDRFLPAFYSVLQNTLVAQDLEQANRVAYGAKRWRVVTINGQLIDKSGTMSGGGTRVAKGAMSSRITFDTSKEQVAKLEADRDAEEQDFSKFQKKKQHLEESLQVLREKLPAIATQIQRGRLEIESMNRNIKDAERRVGELSANSKPADTDKDKMATLEKQVSSLEGEIEKLQMNTVDLEEDIKDLNEKIMEVGGVKLRGQKAKVDGLKEQIKTLSEEISSAEVSKTKAENTRDKQEKANADTAAELTLVKNEMERLQDDTFKQSEEASDSKQKAEEAREALESKKEEMVALKSRLEEQVTELNDTRGAEIEMRNNLEEQQKSLQENIKRLKYWEDKLGRLAIQNVSDLDENVEDQGLPAYTRDELSDQDKNILKGEIALLEERTQNANIELGVIAEYRRRTEEYMSRSNDLAEAISHRDIARRKCEELRRIRLEGFMEGFASISLRLKEMYQMITMGGNAELELVDSLDPFSEGILFSVMPPKKSWKNISNLSGGEKTLSSLALVFALHHYKPTPLYVMDEIDAALDFRNVSIVANYIKERTKNAQFIVISLRNNMFELACRLVGVYKVNHMTKSVTVENRNYVQWR
ncbi:MAG: hypothetical protein M1831_005269 [Alyxoria varia]|nr:MAG: hypothetical protein M1831_005269 [Alyxoria varia]